MDSNEFFICTNISLGMSARLERIRRHWRQVDVAEKAGVTQAEVSAFERGISIVPGARRRILKVLDLVDDSSQEQTGSSRGQP